MTIIKRGLIEGRGVLDRSLEGEPEFPGSPSSSPSFLHSPPGGKAAP